MPTRLLPFVITSGDFTARADAQHKALNGDRCTGDRCESMNESCTGIDRRLGMHFRLEITFYPAGGYKLAVFDGKKAIRGGIPFVFPQFGPWNFGPQHGFGRVVRWTLERAPERLPSGDVEAVFSLMDNEITRSMWNYPFRITYRLILREKELHFHIGVYNPSKEMTFSFNLLLHTYLKVPDVRRCQITGLHGCTFIDKTRDGAIYQEGRDAVTINEWTDRIYQHTPQEHIITNVVSGRKMRLQKYNFPDTVVWNPWMEKARECQDFGDDEYPNMICVEAGHVSTPVILLPGTAFEASQILQTAGVLAFKMPPSCGGLCGPQNNCELCSLNSN
ncbi:aldose 1-epimerase, putative [Anopheles sinensis]|uniref:Galactose mutarotase n=1 Tax=Anopheles sinensis TaxID=74873 RepID=A0A084VYD4_ANOSI|nr:aldose 1-epimerase, putative [Anopheles sinensis]